MRKHPQWMITHASINKHPAKYQCVGNTSRSRLSVIHSLALNSQHSVAYADEFVNAGNGLIAYVTREGEAMPNVVANTTEMFCVQQSALC